MFIVRCKLEAKQTDEQKVDWSNPCCICGHALDMVVYGSERNCDPSILRYLCRECEKKKKTTTLGNSMEHNQKICKCWTDREETADGPACTCECDRCTVIRKNQMLYWRILNLQKRLKKANIDHSDLAFLVWMTLEDQIEERIEKIAIAKLNSLLANITLISQVKRS